MKKLLMLTAAVLALSAGSALAKKQLVIVVKGLDNPFFEAINQGCQKWNAENDVVQAEIRRKLGLARGDEDASASKPLAEATR